MRENQYICGIMETYKINYKSDFDFFIMAKGSNGKSLSFKDFDWTLTLSTPSSKSAFVASRKGGVLVGCTMNTSLAPRIICDNHGLDIGKVSMELAVEIPDALFPDKSRRIVSKIESGIYLTRGTTEVSHLDFGKRITFTIPINGTDEEPVDPEEPAEPSKPNGGGYMGRNIAEGRIYKRNIMPLFAMPHVWYEVPGGRTMVFKLSGLTKKILLDNGSVKVYLPSWAAGTFAGVVIYHAKNKYQLDEGVDFNYSLNRNLLTISLISPYTPMEFNQGCITIVVKMDCSHSLARMTSDGPVFSQITAYDHLPKPMPPTLTELKDKFQDGKKKYSIEIASRVRVWRDRSRHNGHRWRQNFSKTANSSMMGLFKVRRRTRVGVSDEQIWFVSLMVAGKKKFHRIQ